MEAIQEFAQPLEKYLTVVCNTLCQIPAIDNAMKEAEQKTGISDVFKVVAFTEKFFCFFLLEDKKRNTWLPQS